MNGRKPRSDVALDDITNQQTVPGTSNVLGVQVSRYTVVGFISRVLKMAGPELSDTPAFITYLNAACSNIAADDAEYHAILDQADIVYADGQAVVWAARYLGQPLPERVNAGDFIIDFCRAAASARLRIALIGGRPGVAANAAAVWKMQVPDLAVAGTWDGFFSDGGKAVTSAVAASEADIVLIGMGVPLQEKWAWSRRDQLGADVIWCVGALFEYYGEGRARAPVWVRRAGLEWLFRLVLEPRRLWKRYLVGNVRFIWRLFRYRR